MKYETNVITIVT